MQTTTDDTLVNAARNGDDRAFSALVSRHKRRVFGLAARFARDSDELEDICQDVFIKAYDKLANYRGEAPFEHWLIRIATHTCHDALRKRRRESGRIGNDVILQNVSDQAAEERQNACQARTLLKWALNHLSPDEQLVIILLELEEYSVRETAELTGWSESNVKVRGHRARQVLRRILEKNDVR
jgi:RNA polymerase sigma-70 factor (ECF subfamily)